jgi:Anti-sigma-K factor rskA, C-terminal
MAVPLSPASATAGHSRWLPALALGVAVAFGAGILFALHQRDGARREVEELRREQDASLNRVREINQERESLQRRLAWEASLRDLIAQPDARTTVLIPEGTSAHGRVVWNPVTREAVLVASGLNPAPPGKSYEMWVIADGAPVPAGLFQVEGDGRAAFRLPALEQTARVKTFLVTVEPTAGSPAPTGPPILSAAVS